MTKLHTFDFDCSNGGEGYARAVIVKKTNNHCHLGWFEAYPHQIGIGYSVIPQVIGEAMRMGCKNLSGQTVSSAKSFWTGVIGKPSRRGNWNIPLV